MITVTRYHDISCGHRVFGHESVCAHLHGHNYRIHFTVRADSLDDVGRVLDFSAIKERLCTFLDSEWDHKFLIWECDPLYSAIFGHDPSGTVSLPFNPTAENMAEYLLHRVGPAVLLGTGCTLTHVRIEETRKCSAEASL